MTELKVNGGKRSRLQSQTALIVYLFYYINDPHVQLPLCLILIAYIALTINNFTFFYFLIKAKAFQQLKLTPFIALTTLSTTDKQRNILNRTMYEYIWSQHLRPVSFALLTCKKHRAYDYSSITCNHRMNRSLDQERAFVGKVWLLTCSIVCTM